MPHACMYASVARYQQRLAREGRPSTTRYLFHAVNGVGLGHESRAIAIADGLRRVDNAATVLFMVESADVRLVTEAGFPAIQIPPRRSVYEVPQHWRAITPSQFDGLWSALVRSVLHEYKPDVVVHDTYIWPEIQDGATSAGSMQVAVLRVGHHAFDLLASADEALSRIDLVVYPHDATEFDLETRGRLTSTKCPSYFAGRIIRRTRRDVDVAAIRQRYSLDPDDRLLVASDGGGNAMSTRDGFIGIVIEASLMMIDAGAIDRAVVVTGPLNGQVTGHPTPVPKSSSVVVVDYEPQLIDLYAASRAVICRGGHNTIAEVAHLGVPTVAVPARRLQEDQAARIRQAGLVGNVQPARLESSDIASVATRILERSSWHFNSDVPDDAGARKDALARRIASEYLNRSPLAGVQ